MSRFRKLQERHVLSKNILKQGCRFDLSVRILREICSNGTGGGVPTSPENGTTYVRTGLGESLTFRSSNGALFDLLAVDMAEYSTVVASAVTVTFIAYRADGSTVTTDLTTDGIIDGTGPLADFQTFQFGPEFSNLTRVEIPTYGWSLDNLVVSVPEPSSCALFLLGGSALWFFSKAGSRFLRRAHSRA